MRHFRFQILAALFSLLCCAAHAADVLRVDSVETPAGKTVTLPVLLENSSDLVGVQFDITVPYQLTENEGVPVIALSKTRTTNHTVISRKMGTDYNHYYSVASSYGQKYRIIVYSDDNALLIDNSGALLTVQLTVSGELADNTKLPVYLSNVTLTDVERKSVTASTKNGEIAIKEIPRPDLVPADISSEQTAVDPGSQMTVNWKVQNIGQVPTEGGWSEEVALVNLSGTVRKVLTTTYYNETLANGAEVSRQATIQLPTLLGIDGQSKVQVTVIPNENAGEHPSLRDNNTAQSSGNVTVGKQLLFEVSPLYIYERYGNQRIACKLSRSGDWSNLQSFIITKTADDGTPSTDERFSVPEIVTINTNQSGQMFYINVTSNTVLDADSAINLSIKGVSSNYEPVTARIVIEDDEKPSLTITPSKTELTEGTDATVTLTITTDRAPKEAMLITLTTEYSKYFTLPRSVIIPAGETSVNAVIKVVDDDTPNGQITNEFTASAPGHHQGKTYVILNDDDMPVLQLTLSPSQVQESDGPVCVAGVLKRVTNLNKKVTVKLTDDANGGLYFGNRTIQMDKGVEEVHFNFGPKDNQDVDGDRTYTITAAVWLSSCSCNASGESGGHVNAQLTVLDDDGPALRLTSQQGTVKEGGTSTLTITRNNAADEPLTVSLSSDFDEGLEYDHTVVIPAGQQSVDVTITSKLNAVAGDSHTVVFTVETPGYAKGTCFMMVTDQTLPDATFRSFSVTPQTIIVGDAVTVKLEVANIGNTAVLPASTTVKIYQRGQTEALASFTIDDDLPVEGTVNLEKRVTLPSTVGEHQLYAVINENNDVAELSTTNNTSATVSVMMNSPFAATLQTDRARYNQSDVVVFSGQLTGRSYADTEVDLYIINGGARQVQRIMTDNQGRIDYRWPLNTSINGHTIAGVCYPDEGAKTELVAFDVYGLRRTNTNYIKHQMTVGEPTEAVIELLNPGVLPLTGAKVELLSKPDTYDVTLNMPATIEGNGKALLSYTITANSADPGNDWQLVNLKITTDEGVELPLTIYAYARMAQANLVTPNKRITTTMTKGQVREYPVQLINNGQGNTGILSLALPDWISCAQGTTLAGINKGDTATIVLRFKPTDDMQLNVPVTGTIGFNVQYGNGTQASFSITPVSDQTGTLVVEVADEYTYYTDEKPHVKDAEVVLRNSVTNALIAQGKSGEDGLVTFENLPEGYYKLSVTADKHDSYTNNILVDPGVTTRKVVNLSVQAIQVSWTVEETEVEDEYEIVTTVTYETNVPAPVVDLIVPNRIPADSLAEGESLVFYAIATNKGLIKALNAGIPLPERTGIYTWEPMGENTGLTIAPQQSYILPVKVTRQSVSGSRRAGSDDGCITRVGVEYEWECGDDKKWHKVEKPVTYKTCPGRPSEPGSPGGGGPGGGGGGPGSPGGGGGTGYTSSTYTPHVTSNNDCNPCFENLKKEVVKCVESLIPIYGCVSGLADCKNNDHKTAGDKFDCAATAVSCAAETCGYLATATIIGAPAGGVCKIIGWIANGLVCTRHIVPVIGKCILQALSDDSRSYDGGRRAQTEYSFLNDFADASVPARMEWQALYDYISELMGDTIWVHNTKMEDLDNMLAIVGTYKNERMEPGDLRKYKPDGITNEQFDRFIERVNNTRGLGDATSDNVVNIATLEACEDSIRLAEQKAFDAGYTSVDEWWSSALQTTLEKLNDPRASVCSTISLQIKQTMVMTRQAFRGTLTVFNGHETEAMTDMKLDLVVSDRYNNVATSHEFQINAESLKNLTGPLTLDGGWTLEPNSEGTATVLFIPTKYAAPTEPTEYSFGGTLSYTDPYTGLEVTRELYPVTLTVKPSPELDLTYFMQRDIYGDDPLTPDVVEPMEDAEFALLINNKGYGDATNVRMTTMQPEIVENEKGLAIEFQIVSSQVNGGPAALSFGQTIANDLGTIPAHSQTYAQWWLQSTLLGHFTSYKVEATHVTSYGNEDLSLIDQVTIHELIHGFTPPAATATSGSAAGRAFLVNDVEDAFDLPDRVYFTDGTQQEVTVAQGTNITKQSGYEYTLTVLPAQKGWNYASLLDPTVGRQKLLKVVRQSDSQELPIDNAWQTSRSLRDGQEWINENRLHIVGDMAATGETYLLTYEQRPNVELDVELSGPVYDPEFKEQGLVTADVDDVKVTFTKPIQAETFTADDITFSVQGEKQDLSLMTITAQEGEQNTYLLGLKELNKTLPNGYYVLNVQTAGITDSEGYNGLLGRKIDWVLFRGGLIQLNTTPVPEQGGQITWLPVDLPTHSRSLNRAAGDSPQYGSVIRLTATPNEGYTFVNWTLDGEVVSTEPVYETTATSDMNFVANFKPLQYKVEVTAGDGGTIVGTGTGFYDYGTALSLVATPQDEFVLEGWTIDGQPAAHTGDTLTVTVKGAMNVEARFARSLYQMTITMPRGWNWVSTYLSEPMVLGEMEQYANSVISQTDQLVRDPEQGLVGGISQLAAGQAYKVEAASVFSRSMRGHLHSGRIDLREGWNWIAYPHRSNAPLTIVTNAQQGDVISAQTGYAEYADGTWEGTLQTLVPGTGYLYKSKSEKTLVFDVSSTQPATSAPAATDIDIRRYPSTMNVTARIYRNGTEQPAAKYNVYAMASGDLRGTSQVIGQNHYLTVYGSDPVVISFIVEDAETGDAVEPQQKLTFQSEVYGSRLSPYVLEIADISTGIDQLSSDSQSKVYTLDGILVSRDATLKGLRRLPKGVYIVNGKKRYVK